jgi:hypothetical protein
MPYDAEKRSIISCDCTGIMGLKGGTRIGGRGLLKEPRMQRASRVARQSSGTERNSSL